MMSRIDFMNELESLLSDIPIDEKEEALQYYNGYFEDAGADHEEEILKELGSPQRMAKIIKAELDANTVDRENRGYFTEKGYQDTIYEDEKFELVDTAKKEAGEPNRTDSKESSTKEQQPGSEGVGYQNSRQQDSQQQNNQQQNNQQPNKQYKNTGLIVLLCIFGIPIWLPLFLSFFGIVIGVIAAIFGIVLGFGFAGIAMMVAGIALFFAGLIQISVPFIGLLLCGSGLLVLGLGMLFTFVSTVLCKKVLPAMVRGFVNICRLPFRNRGVIA